MMVVTDLLSRKGTVVNVVYCTHIPSDLTEVAAEPHMATIKYSKQRRSLKQ